MYPHRGLHCVCCRYSTDHCKDEGKKRKICLCWVFYWSKVSSRDTEREKASGIGVPESSNLKGGKCRNLFKGGGVGSVKLRLSVHVCACLPAFSVSNHVDPRVAWLGQGAGIQWRGRPTVAASFRHQSKSGMVSERSWHCLQTSQPCCQGACGCVCVLFGCRWMWILGLISLY